MKKAKQSRIHYAWIVAGVTFAVLMVSASLRATASVLMVPLEREFGWSRATTASSGAVGILLYGLVGPFCAAVAQRFGVRRVMAVGMLALSGAVLLATRVTAPWQLMAIWGLFVGTATGMVATVLGAIVVGRWFAARQGMVLGALTASTATGQLIFLPILATLAAEGGWRAALWLVAGAAAATVPLSWLLVRESPADKGLAPYGAALGEAAPPPRPGNPAVVAVTALARAARQGDFWLLAGTFFVCGASTNGLIGMHLIPACVDVGIPEVRAARLLATMGIFDLVGTTLSGWLSDRWDSRRLLFAYYALRGLSLVFLPDALLQQAALLQPAALGQAPLSAGMAVFTVFYGLDWIATVPPTVRLATASFGREDGTIVFGWVLAAHQVGAAIAAQGAGFIRTGFGDYRVAFLISGGLCLVAALLSLRIGRGRRGAEGLGALEPAA